jgi:hypothetical protein
VQFDHLVHWVPDLDAAMRDYQALGFTVQRAGQHPQSGTHNAGWRLDTRYIELIAVRNEAVARLVPGWPEIDATLRAGGGVLGFGVLVADVTATVANLRSRDVPWVILKPDRSSEPTAPPAYGKVPGSKMGPGGRPSSLTTACRSMTGPPGSGSRDSRRIHGLCKA